MLTPPGRRGMSGEWAVRSLAPRETWVVAVETPKQARAEVGAEARRQREAWAREAGAPQQVREVVGEV